MKKVETANSGGQGKDQDKRKVALGKALKANLARRKAQARARKTEDDKKAD